MKAEPLHVRYRLGAEELIELGSSKKQEIFSRRPYLAGRIKEVVKSSPYLGSRSLGQESVYILDILADVGGFIADALGFALNALGDLIDIPLGLLSQGVDIVFNGVAGLLVDVPILGGLLSQIVVMGGSLIKFGLSIPGLVLHGLGNILAGIGKALKQTGSDAENEKKVDGAKKDIVDKAPPGLKDSVRKILDSSGVSGSNLTPAVRPDGTPIAPPAGGSGSLPGGALPPSPGDVSLENVLAVGLPVAGVAALIAVLA